MDSQGLREGYDENGGGMARDWHGFTKNRRPEAWLGAATAAPFRIEWDRRMISGDLRGVRARVAFRCAPGIVYKTAPLEAVPLPRKQKARVTCVAAAARDGGELLRGRLLVSGIRQERNPRNSGQKGDRFFGNFLLIPLPW